MKGYAAPAAFALALTFLAGCGSVVEEHAEAASRAASQEKSKEAKPKEQTLADAIDLGLKLLIDGRFNAFAERFIPPHEKANIEDLAQELANDEDEAAEMISLLRHIKGRAPAMSEDGSTAAFDLKGAGLGLMELKPLEFEKIDGLWYMR